MQTRTKESRKRLQSLILLTAFTCVLLIVSTYAWFTYQKDVSVTNIRAKVKVADGLQISLDADHWTQELDLATATATEVSDLLVPYGENVTRKNADGESTEVAVVYGPAAGHTNHVPDEFKPVSTSGETKEALKQNLLFMDGTYENKKITKIRECDDRLEDNQEGYFAFDIFLKNLSSKPEDAETLQLNSDSSAWVLREGTIIKDGDIEYKGNDDSGLQNAVRVAFAKYEAVNQDGIVSALQKITPSDIRATLNNTGLNQISSVSIWEPNSDVHVQRIVERIPQLFENGSNPITGNNKNQFFTRTLLKPSDPNASISVYDWSNNNTGLAVADNVQTVQTTSTSDYDYYITEGVKNLTTITGEEFKIPTNQIVKLRVYIYVEGQDPDCDNDASTAGGLEFNIGLTKTTDEGDVSAYKYVTGEERDNYTAPSGT